MPPVRRIWSPPALREVCVVIPHFRSELSNSEKISLDRCVAILDGHPLIMVKPQSLNIRHLLTRYPLLHAENFTDDYFRGIAGYNRLMLSDEFYARFSQYKYILIHQLDCFVFSDQLLQWCRQGYDYIGAPWLPLDPPSPYLKKQLAAAFLRCRYRLTDEPNVAGDGANDLQYHYRSGNGGFSLRRVAKMREALRCRASRLDRYRYGRHYTCNEDIFFSIEANRYWPLLKLPGWRKALQFSWESQPALAEKLNGGVLPFGCHAWNKLHRDEWRLIFSRLDLSLDLML